MVHIGEWTDIYSLVKFYFLSAKFDKSRRKKCLSISNGKVSYQQDYYFTRVNVSVSVQGPFTVETELAKKRRPGLPNRIL